MFPGGGGQRPGMARSIYREEQVFRDEVDRCCRLLEPHLGLDLRTLLFPRAVDDATRRQLDEMRYALPAIFVVELALARLWTSWGIEPSALIGHSLGEYTAAHLAGVFCLEDVLALVARRSRLMEQTPPGAMLAVSLPREELEALLGDELDLAAVNLPG